MPTFAIKELNNEKTLKRKGAHAKRPKLPQAYSFSQPQHQAAFVSASGQVSAVGHEQPTARRGWPGVRGWPHPPSIAPIDGAVDPSASQPTLPSSHAPSAHATPRRAAPHTPPQTRRSTAALYWELNRLLEGKSTQAPPQALAQEGVHPRPLDLQCREQARRAQGAGRTESTS